MLFAYLQKDLALVTMEAEVHIPTAHKGHWPPEDSESLGLYVGLLERAQQFATGEKVLQQYLTQPENDAQRQWLEDRLQSLYNEALAHGGEVSLGRSERLFEAIVGSSLGRLEAATHENAAPVHCGKADTNVAYRPRTESAGSERRRFANSRLGRCRRCSSCNNPSIATPWRHRGNYRTALGPAAALQYVVERLEQYPDRFQSSWENSWYALGNQLTRLRAAADARTDKKSLKSRMLKIVIAQLKQELLGNSSNYHAIYYRYNSEFWSEIIGIFERAANEVYSQHKTSGRRVPVIAGYLAHGLDNYQRATQILLISERDGILDNSGRNQFTIPFQPEIGMGIDPDPGNTRRRRSEHDGLSGTPDGGLFANPASAAIA